MDEQTRRDWVFTIGQTALALTIPGKLDSLAVPGTTLPPGVYLPSLDHLGHALMSADRYHPIPPGCPTDYVTPRIGPYRPLFFSQTEFPVVSRLIQVMLGEFGSDGNAIQEVTEWFDLYLSEAQGVRDAENHLDPLYRALAKAYYGRSEQERPASVHPEQICREGLKWIYSAAHAIDAQSFLRLGTEEQTAVLNSVGDGHGGKPDENSGTRFFALLKSQVIFGFYTSRQGLKELDYKGNAFYARSPGWDVK